MNFSLEVWKRSFQGLGSLAESNATAAAAAVDEDDNEAGSEKFQTLQEAHAMLEKKVRVLETRLTYKEAQLLNFQEKVASLQSKLEEREREAGERKKRVEELENDVQSLQQQEVEWNRKQGTYTGELQELVSMLEDRCVALENEKEKCRGLETCLRERTEEIQQRDEAMKLRDEELNSMRENFEQAGLKIQELELMLGKLVEFSREKDDKLDASEWAVQQLGVYEIARAKASLAEAERDHLQLQQEFSDLEKELKLKDEELAEASSYFTRQLRKLESECIAVREKLEAEEMKQQRLRSEQEATLSRIEEYEKQLISEQETNFRLNNSVVVFQRDAAAANEKLREVNLELERSQVDNKGLLEQMLLLHQNFLDHQHDEHNNDLELKCGKRCRRASDGGLNQTQEEAGKNSLILPPKRQRHCEELV